jgi:hypothetical protein
MQQIAIARAQTVVALEKALRYSHDLQKPAQIDYYRAHIAHLDKLAAGEPCEKAKVDMANWNVVRVVLEARSAAERSG